MTVDPIYIKAAIETLELILQLYTFLKENQKVNELSNQLSQIEMKANARIVSSLGRTLEIRHFDNQEGKPTEYWKGVRDMANYAIKQWNHLQNEQKFVISLKTTRSSLLAIVTPTKQDVSPLEEILDKIQRGDDDSADDRDLESPPAASAEAIPIEEEDQDIEANSEEQLPPQDTPHPDSPPSSLPEKLLDDNDELLSSTLKDALRILRDEEDNEE